MMDLLSGQRGRPGQALVGFGEGGGGAEAGEDLSRHPPCRFCMRNTPSMTGGVTA